MNCKPGDLAVIVRGSKWSGILVEVMYLSPGFHDGPDGYPSHAETAGAWMCKSLGREFDAPVGRYGTRKTLYCCISDAGLRPIRPGDLEDETPTVRELEAA